MTTEDQCRREFEAALSRAQQFTIGEGGDAWLGWQMCWNRHKSDRRDAERYRWLAPRIEIRKVEVLSGAKKDAISVRIGCDVVNTKRPYLSNGSKELDASIDAAIAKEQGQKQSQKEGGQCE